MHPIVKRIRDKIVKQIQEKEANYRNQSSDDYRINELFISIGLREAEKICFEVDSELKNGE